MTPTTIVFETHSASLDNEAGLASGWFDVDLSAVGERQARALGERRAGDPLAAVYCSDLRRARRTAEIAFASTGVGIVPDARLRECDYGDLTRAPAPEIERLRTEYIDRPFPHGESYQDVVQRVRACLHDITAAHRGQMALIIGHRAVLYALERLLTDRPLADIVSAPWRWQPGWQWTIEENGER